MVGLRPGVNQGKQMDRDMTEINVKQLRIGFGKDSEERIQFES